jgi:WD40 repeat protein
MNINKDVDKSSVFSGNKDGTITKYNIGNDGISVELTDLKQMGCIRMVVYNVESLKILPENKLLTKSKSGLVFYWNMNSKMVIQKFNTGKDSCDPDVE